MQGPGPGARTWICPRVLLGEPGSTVGRLTQLMAPPGTSPDRNLARTRSSESSRRFPRAHFYPPRAGQSGAGAAGAAGATVPPSITAQPCSWREISLSPRPLARALGSRRQSRRRWAGLPGRGLARASPRPIAHYKYAGAVARLVVDRGMAGPRECGKGEAPWKKMSKEVGGLRRVAGAEDYSLEIRWNF